MIPPLHWNEDAGRVDLLDQTRLPVEELWLAIETPDQMAEAIRLLRVRGAPASFGDFGGLSSDLGYSHRISVQFSLEQPSLKRQDPDQP